MPDRIFISYASENAAVAERIRTGLEQAGVACWIAPRDIEPGTSFPAAITAAIQSCGAQVLLLTPESNASRHVLSEVELAFNAGKPILAILVGKVTPSSDLQYFISTSHWFDAEAAFDDDDLTKLRVDLERLLAGERVRLEVQRRRAWTRPAIAAASMVVVLGIAAAVFLAFRTTSGPAPAPTASPSPSPSPVTPTPTPASTPAPRSKLNPADGQTYLWIPPGSFAMGCSSGDGDCQPDELPVHTVRIRNGFWMARTEVTNAQYEKLMKATDRLQGATGAHPAVAMSRPDAKAFCAKVGGRLPTEAEWEYAARAGSRERYYDTLSAIAWFENNSDDHSHPVAQKAPNAFGLYDMLGNVYEWVLDRYYNKYDDTTDDVEEPVPPNASAVARGGAWHSDAKNVRVSTRHDVPRDYADLDIGFRCAMNGT